MRRFVDLHTHSTASDGDLSPERLVAAADEAKLAALALTDHDTTAGLDAARKAAEGFGELQFIAGIEVSARYPTGTLHILGLDIDVSCGELQAMLRQLRDLRDERNPRMIERLRALGVDVTMEDVLAVAERDGPRAGDEIVSRLHIAEALRRKGAVRTTHEAFALYIGREGTAYVEKERMEPREVFSAIRAAGGVAALAHPPQLRCANDAQFERILRGFLQDGLNGLEVYHTDHTVRQTRLYLTLARRFGLEVVGGSDFHGATKATARLGRPRVPLAVLTGQLKRIAAEVAEDAEDR